MCFFPICVLVGGDAREPIYIYIYIDGGVLKQLFLKRFNMVSLVFISFDIVFLYSFLLN